METSMKNAKILIPLYKEEVAPRFDLAAEVAIIQYRNGKETEKRIVVLSRPSAEDLCHMILTEQVDTVICNGIEDEYYQYLKWKKIRVIDSVAGEIGPVLARYSSQTLVSGDILFDSAD